MSQAARTGGTKTKSDAASTNTTVQARVADTPVGGKAKRSSRTTAPTEIELKLSCDPGHLQDVASSPVVARDQRDVGTDLDLTATYYDTPNLDLHKAGAALRVRTDGKRFVMTLKRKSRGDGRVLERKETKVAVKGMDPDIAALAKRLSAKTFAQVKRHGLVPMFTTEVRRHIRMLDTPHGAVELAIDRGWVRAGKRSEEISEIELELVDGSVEAVLQLAQELASDFPLRPSLRSKSARGFDLALDRGPPVARAPKLKFEVDATLAGVLDRVLSSVVQHLMENQPAAEDGRNPEGLHQYRVALRRLLAVLGLLRSISPSPKVEAFRDDVKWLLASLNDARDWDAFATQILPSMPVALCALDGFGALETAVEQLRRRARDKARATITDPRTGRLQIGLALWLVQEGWRAGASAEGASLLAGPAGDFASRTLGELHRKALERGAHFEELSPPERHKLRIQLKKLRYTADFFLPLLGKGSRHYVATLARLQEALGRYNDRAVAGRLVRHVMDGEISAAASDSSQAVLDWLAENVAGVDAKLVSAWRKFQSIDLP